MPITRSLLVALFLWSFGCSTGSRDSGAPALSAGTSPIGQKPVGTGRSKLWLSAVPGQNAVTLTVNYEKGDPAAPRVADIRIAHSETLKLESAAAGEGATGAGKELTTQEPAANVVRLILLSKDTRELKSGALAQVTFARAQAGEAKFDILMDNPVFAPAESMQGLLIGDPLKL